MRTDDKVVHKASSLWACGQQSQCFGFWPLWKFDGRVIFMLNNFAPQ
jgi:hypothetical protein